MLRFSGHQVCGILTFTDIQLSKEQNFRRESRITGLNLAQ